MFAQIGNMLYLCIRIKDCGMDVYFICLANSLKRRGRCIAGIAVTIDNGRWFIVRKEDGSPKWVRPIDATTDFGEILIGEAQAIPLLSVVKLVDIVPIPDQAHQEDVHYQQMVVVGRVEPSIDVLNQFLDQTHSVIFYGTDRSISTETYSHADHSLMFVHADKAEIVAEVKEDKTRYRMLLTWNSVMYDLSVTDPDCIAALNEQRMSVGVLQDVYVTLSLGLIYEERHHKLIASVIVPSQKVMDNTIIVDTVENEEIDARPFTKAECKTIRHAFVVPSKDGYAVCFRRKNGGEDFLPLTGDCEIDAWQEISLKRSLVVTYHDGKQRVKAYPRTRWIRRLLGFKWSKTYI